MCIVQDETISTCFCFGSGHAAGTLSLDGSAYPAGATLNLALRVQNSTSKPFKTIRVSGAPLCGRSAALQTPFCFLFDGNARSGRA